MAASTGIVVAAGGITMVDLLLSKWDPDKGLKVAVATAAAALVSAGLDKILPGLGTGGAVLLLLAVLYRSVPTLAAKINFS